VLARVTSSTVWLNVHVYVRHVIFKTTLLVSWTSLLRGPRRTLGRGSTTRRAEHLWSDGNVWSAVTSFLHPPRDPDAAGCECTSRAPHRDVLGRVVRAVPLPGPCGPPHRRGGGGERGAAPSCGCGCGCCDCSGGRRRRRRQRRGRPAEAPLTSTPKRVGTYCPPRHLSRAAARHI